METLYQILCVLQRADLKEPVRWATLEEYTVYVNIIDMQQKGAEQWGLGARFTQDHQEQRGGGTEQDKNRIGAQAGEL